MTTIYTSNQTNKKLYKDKTLFIIKDYYQFSCVGSRIMTIYDDYIAYYNKYKELYGKVLVLMEVGSFWELYDANDNAENARIVCDLLDITLTKRNKNVSEISAQNPYMAGFPTHALDKFLSILIDANYTVILVSQVTSPPNPKRDVTHILSKGTCAFENINAQGTKRHTSPQTCNTSYIACIYNGTYTDFRTRESKIAFGFACVDLSTGHCMIMDSTNCDEVYSLIQKTNPVEIILIGDKIDTSPMADFSNMTTSANIIDHTLIYDKDIHKHSFQRHVLELAYKSKFDNMLSIHENLDFENGKNSESAKALVYLLQYAYNHNKLLISNIMLPEIASDGKTLRLSSWTAQQLDITGLDKILNRCYTNMGKRYFTHRIWNPFNQSDVINASLSGVNDYLTIYERSSNDFAIIATYLKEMYDVERLFRRWTVGKLRLMDFTSIIKTLNALNAIFTIKESHAESCDVKCISIKVKCRELLDYINTVINMDAISSHNDSNNNMCPFKPFVSEELDELYRELQQVSTNTRKFVQVFPELFFRLEQNDTNGFYLMTTTKRFAEFKKSINTNEQRQFVDEFEEHKQASNALKLTHKALRQSSEKKNEVLEKIKTITHAFFSKWLLESGAIFNSSFSQITDSIKQIDFYYTCARNAKDFHYARPIILDATISVSASSYAFKGIRHPIIERLERSNQSIYVQNDIAKTSDGMLLFGLNAAGKSSLMKAVGLNIYMAQTGMYCAANSAKISPYKKMYSRIGHTDNLYMGQSTFMVEMQELREILKNIDRNTIVLGDELCAGTEAHSALAIVSSALQKLCSSGATFILTTHLHELLDLPNVSKLVDEQKIVIKHLHAQSDPVNGTITFERKLRDGQGSKMYGLEVCSALGFDVEFIDNAFSIRKSKYNSDVFVSTTTLCSVCKKSKATEVHHINEQHSANASQVIEEKACHKNHIANLVPLCEVCHDAVHHHNLIIHGYKATTKGLCLDFEYTKQYNDKIEELINKLVSEKKYSANMISKHLAQFEGIHMTPYKIHSFFRKS